MTNVQPIETKIPSFNEETLFWIFYSCPQDIKQHLAAQELWGYPFPQLTSTTANSLQAHTELALAQETALLADQGRAHDAR